MARRFGFRFLITALATTLAPSVAFAYRPFDSTDADVVPPGELELEMGPTGYVRSGRDRFLVAPAAIVNVGALPRWELVLQGRELVGVGVAPPERGGRFLDTGAFLKGVLREGSLQGASGPSVATEFGALLPTSDDPRGLGGVLSFIGSQRASFGTLHLNASVSRTRGERADVFGGIIVEGPFDWRVRPAAEFFYDAELGAQDTASVLLGAIWRAHEMISVDAGMRAARAGSSEVVEARFGFTFAFAVWHPR